MTLSMTLLDGTENKDSNIIDIRGEPLELTEIEKKAESCVSRHKSVIVDAHERLIHCKECGKVIDPFDYLHVWASEGTHRMERLKSLDDEIRRKHREFEEMKAVLAREKAKVRKINPDAPEVITWKRQMARRIA